MVGLDKSISDFQHLGPYVNRKDRVVEREPASRQTANLQAAQTAQALCLIPKMTTMSTIAITYTAKLMGPSQRAIFLCFASIPLT